MDLQPFIYGLVDPFEPKHVRYVGMTIGRRLRPFDHMRNARKEKKHSHLLHWIRKIQSEGREPSVLILEELFENSSRDFIGFVEKCYIKSLRGIGHRLTNVAEGGNGGDVGPEGRAKIAATLTGYKHTAEACLNMGASRKGGKFTLERCANISTSLKGKPVPEERRRRIALTLTGRKASAETRAKQSAGIKAAKSTPEARLIASLTQKAIWIERRLKKGGV